MEIIQNLSRRNDADNESQNNPSSGVIKHDEIIFGTLEIDVGANIHRIAMKLLNFITF